MSQCKVEKLNFNVDKQINFVTHEIRNNLSICDTYSQILKNHLKKNGIENSSISNAIDCIQKSIQMINVNLMDLKTLNNDFNNRLDLNNLILKSIELSKAYIQDKQIKFNSDLCKNILVFADENKLSACFINIIKNAIEAIETSGEISIKAFKQNNHAIILISNTGAPISKDSIDKIFEYGHSTKNRGSGFGLCLSKQYLTSILAKLILEQSTKEKTIFRIEIPTIGGI